MSEVSEENRERRKTERNRETARECREAEGWREGMRDVTVRLSFVGKGHLLMYIYFTPKRRKPNYVSLTYFPLIHDTAIGLVQDRNALQISGNNLFECRKILPAVIQNQNCFP